MTSPFENSMFSFTSPQGILRDHLRNSLLAYQSRNMLSRSNSSFRRPRPRPHQKEIMSLLESYTQGPPLYPFYLKDTIFALLVEEQYNLYREKYGNTNPKRENSSNSKAKASDISAPARRCRLRFDTTSVPLEGPINTAKPNTTPPKSNSFLARLETQDLRLPTAWSTIDRGEFLDLNHDNMEVVYNVGFGKEESDASSIRSNYSAKPQCGLFYYEVQVMTTEPDAEGHISVGFCGEYSRLDRLPGTDGYSWGYHGENGYLYGASLVATHLGTNGGGSKYGPRFGVGDIIGCGIDFRDNTAFFTKNGAHLGTAFRNIRGRRFYPMVGFKTSGDGAIVNFGQYPSSTFVFDIHQYRKDVASRVVHHVLSLAPSASLLSTASISDTVSSSSSSSSAIEASELRSASEKRTQPQKQQKQARRDVSNMDRLVMDYLNHGGYMNTFLTMKKEMKNVNSSDKEQEKLEYERIKIRQDICTALRNGQIDSVFIKCQQHYPDMLTHHPRLMFRLRCQKFIAMVISSRLYTTPTAKKQNSVQTGSKRRRDLNDVDSDPVENHNCGGGDDDKEDDEMYSLDDLQTVMDFGQFLQRTYGSKNENDEDVSNPGVSRDSMDNIDVYSELTATFSSLAYTKISDNPNAFLGEPAWRDSIAYELNSAMLSSEGFFPASSLERLYRQTNVAIHELVLNGDGQASMMPALDSLLQ